jgi:hypothetical protein
MNIHKTGAETEISFCHDPPSPFFPDLEFVIEDRPLRM